jgi:hypothetical protein
VINKGKRELIKETNTKLKHMVLEIDKETIKMKMDLEKVRDLYVDVVAEITKVSREAEL